ncbi:hypothetical protein GCM10020001_075000 [Nonomuraea salmonea]
MPAHPSRRDLIRLLGVAATAAAGVPALSSCAGAPAPQSAAPGTFTVYWNAGHDYQAYRKVIAEFEQAHKVTVNLQKNISGPTCAPGCWPTSPPAPCPTWWRSPAGGCRSSRCPATPARCRTSSTATAPPWASPPTGSR